MSTDFTTARQRHDEIVARMRTTADRQPVATLLESLAILDAKPRKDDAEALTYRVICESIEDRHDLTDEVLDEIIGADDFHGTYAEGLRIALRRAGVAA